MSDKERWRHCWELYKKTQAEYVTLCTIAERLAGTLRSVEWHEDINTYERICPSCNTYDHEGHQDWCKLDHILKEWGKFSDDSSK